jgi:putative transposase
MPHIDAWGRRTPASSWFVLVNSLWPALPVWRTSCECPGKMPTKTYKFRLYPTSAQESVLRETLETCRGLYNSLLHERKHDYEVDGNAPSCSEQQKHLSVWKETHPELRAVFSQVLQEVCKRVDLAFAAFFRRVQAGEKPGYPRFKGGGQYDSFTYPQKGFAIGGNSVTLSKIGEVKAVLHRPVEGKVKTCTVRRQGEKWFVCFSCEAKAQPLPLSSEQVGIDVGLHHFAVLSNGECVENPRFLRKEEKALSERVHVCPCCGLVLDRDVNAARNILKRAVGQHSVTA